MLRDYSQRLVFETVNHLLSNCVDSQHTLVCPCGYREYWIKDNYETDSIFFLRVLKHAMNCQDLVDHWLGMPDSEEMERRNQKLEKFLGKGHPYIATLYHKEKK